MLRSTTRSMTSPQGDTISALTSFLFRDLPIVPVVLDPIIARHLRVHQKEGTFYAPRMSFCLMGL